MHTVVQGRIFFQFAIQKYRIRDTSMYEYNYNFACCFVWVWNLVSDTEGGTWAKGVWELGAEEGTGVLISP